MFYISVYHNIVVRHKQEEKGEFLWKKKYLC